jgi:hypothetical protein
MGLRILQILLAIGNCFYGAFLLDRYGRVILHVQAWPLMLGQQVVLLVAISVLPTALVGVRFPLIAGIVEFACGFIGRQLLHDAPMADLKSYAAFSMGIAFAILAVAVVRGIVEVTQEAFGEIPDQDDKPVRGIA